MATLPPLYHRWITELLGEPVEGEPQSTCANCAMCPGGGAGRRPAARTPLRLDMKCCTYTPAFANYQVGALLLAGGAQAEVLRGRLAGGREVTPLGLSLPAAQQGVDAHLAPYTGMHEAQRCPHIVVGDDGASCGVWQQRDAVCSTWWCRHERAQPGSRFWWALRDLLRGIEHALALWCCIEDGLHSDQLVHALASHGIPRNRGVGPDVDRAAFWGALAGDEEGFYLRCWERVRGLSWADVRRVGGVDLHALALHVHTSRRRLDEPVPERLTLGEYTVGRMDATGAAIETYSPYDPLGVPAVLLPLLHRFDGRPVVDVEAELHAEHGITIPPAYLRELVDYGVLVEASYAGNSAGSSGSPSAGPSE